MISRLFSSGNRLCYTLRKNVHASGDHDRAKEALLPEGGGRSISKLKDKLDSGDILLGDEVNKCKDAVA